MPSLHSHGLLIACLVAVAPGTALAQRQETSAPRPRTDRYGDPLPAGAVARLGARRFRCEGSVQALRYSPDGKLLAGQSKDELVVWEAVTGRPLWRISGLVGTRFGLEVNQEGRRAFDFTPDGQTLAAVMRSGKVGLWEASNGRLRRRLPLARGVEGGSVLRCSPDGSSLAVVVEEARVCLLDAATGKVRWQHVHEKATILDLAVLDLAFAPDGKTLALGPVGSSLELWDTATGRLLRRIEGGTAKKPLVSAAFSPDGKLVAGGSDRAIVLADAATGKERARLVGPDAGEEIGHDGLVVGLAFTPDGRSLVSCRTNHTEVRVWDLDTRKLRSTLVGSSARSVLRIVGLSTALALSPDGRTVALGTSATVLSLWDLTTGKKKFSDLDRSVGPVECCAFLPDGKTLVTGGEDPPIRFWDVPAGRVVRRLPAPAFRIALTPDGRRMFTQPYSLPDERPGLWDLSRAARSELAGTEDGDEIRQAEFTRGGRLLVGIAPGEAGTDVLVVWDGNTGRLLRRLAVPGFNLDNLALSSDGQMAILAHPDGILVYDLKGGRARYPLKGHKGGALLLALSPTERVLVSSGDLADNRLHWWELSSGREIWPGREKMLGTIGVLGVSPDGRLAASVHYPLEWDFPREGRDIRIRLWDMSTGAEVGRLSGLKSLVASLSFSPDGSRLASGLTDGTALVWDVSPYHRRLHRPRPPSAKELPACWADLADPDPGKAYQAIGRLTAAPGPAVAFLRKRLRPAEATDRGQFRRLIADLDSDSFAVRKEATARLREELDQMAPLLRKERAARHPPEVRRRIEGLLAAASGPVTSSERLREIRAAETLERIGSPEAKRLLRSLAAGAPGARLTQEAKATLERLTRRAAR